MRQTGLVMERELDMDDILPADVEMIVSNIKRAVKLYGEKAELKAVQIAAMKAAKDFSWTKATKEYIDHFLVRAPRTSAQLPQPVVCGYMSCMCDKPSADRLS
jgi:hypothetical protein